MTDASSFSPSGPARPVETSSPLKALDNPPACPKCGLKMRLARLDPHPVRGADQVTFDCSCGELLVQPAG
jgi:hypothetical protein